MTRLARFAAAFALVVLFGAGTAGAQFEGVQIVPHEASANVFMLEGAGGNIAICKGPTGVFMVDSQFAPLTPQIREAIENIAPGPVRFLVNTHWHGDHVGGNANLQDAGAIVVAHDNVRKRMSAEHFNDLFDRQMPASPEGALPVVTFSKDVTFHWDGGVIEVFHVGPAHTDTDAMIYFRNENVLHMGDIFFSGRFPFIDVTSGGTAKGYVPAIDRALSVIDEETVIIPGHGPLSSKTELLAFREVLEKTTTAVEAAVKDGKTLDEIKAMNLTAEFPESWGTALVKPDLFITTIYRSCI